MMLSDLKVQVENASTLSEEERKQWIDRLPSMTREELQALAGLLLWMFQEKAAGETIKKSGGAILKKAFATMNQNAYQKSKRLLLQNLEKELDKTQQ